jgi:ElaB/YqjD/DUF883 family membrane-anchored ribosome-binding protein
LPQQSTRLLVCQQRLSNVSLRRKHLKPVLGIEKTKELRLSNHEQKSPPLSPAFAAITPGVRGSLGVASMASEHQVRETCRFSAYNPESVMEQTAEQVYTDLMRQLASPSTIQPSVLADAFRDVERMHSMGQIADWQLENAREAYARTASAVGGKIGDAASWAMGKATDTLHAAADQVRERATKAVATYTKEDPIRAILIAAGTGALLMGLLAMSVRSGVRTVKRRMRR